MLFPRVLVLILSCPRMFVRIFLTGMLLDTIRVRAILSKTLLVLRAVSPTMMSSYLPTRSRIDDH
jgi:hypothetical protein